MPLPFIANCQSYLLIAQLSMITISAITLDVRKKRESQLLLNRCLGSPLGLSTLNVAILPPPTPFFTIKVTQGVFKNSQVRSEYMAEQWSAARLLQSPKFDPSTAQYAQLKRPKYSKP